MFDAIDWVESQHPRAKNGQFASAPDADGGSGGFTSHSCKQSMTPAHRTIVDALKAKRPKVNEAAQNKHSNAASASAATRAEQAASNPGAYVHPKSYFIIPMRSAHANVINKINKGEFTCEKNDMGVPILIVELDNPCGIAYDTKGKNPKKTNKVYVTCSAKGYHIYPVY